MTQGMVCHETYRDDDEWLFPDQVRRLADGRYVTVEGERSVTVGRVEKMSKSRRNVVDPEAIIRSFGADTARLFMLSDSPPARDLEWSEAGLEGAWRFLHRLWHRITDPAAALPAVGTSKAAQLSRGAQELERAIHKTIKAVSDSIEHWRFNSAVAQIRELSNTLGAFECGDAGDGWMLRHGYEVLLRLIEPMTPHIAEEIWAYLGHADYLCDQPWPVHDEDLVMDDTVTIGVQVNGKMRGTLAVERGAGDDEIRSMALSLDNVRRALGDRPARRIIVVPDRIVNVVV